MCTCMNMNNVPTCHELSKTRLHTYPSISNLAKKPPLCTSNHEEEITFAALNQAFLESARVAANMTLATSCPSLYKATFTCVCKETVFIICTFIRTECPEHRWETKQTD